MALHFTRDEFAVRQHRACAEMAKAGLYGLLIFRQESMYWLTGYDTGGYSMLLRGTAKLGPPITRQLEFQPGDQGLGGQRMLRHRGDDAAQRCGGVGQGVGRDRHARSGSDPQSLGLAKP